MSVEITPVRGFADVKEFVELPFRLHKGTAWIPPLKLERYAQLSPRSNPFFKTGDAQMFLARDHGRVVGRITAQVDHKYNEFHHTRWGSFGFIEFENDQAIVDGLLAAAEVWLRQRNCDRMIGPFDFTNNDECGILIEGAEIEPMIRQPWHPPYYQRRVEQAGLNKVVDVFHWHLTLADRTEGRMSQLLPKVAARARDRYGVRIRNMSWLHLGRDLKEFAKVYNSAWEHNWGYEPLNDHDIADMSLLYRLLYMKGWFMLAETDADGVIGAAISIPDPNQFIKLARGRVIPNVIIPFLRRKQIIDRCRVGFLGVLPEYEYTGAGAALYLANFETAANGAIKWGEPGWILETNHSMNRGLEEMGGYVYKRARFYERLLEADAAPAAPPDSVRRYVPKVI